MTESAISSHTPKICNILTQWDLVPVGTALIYITGEVNCCLWYLEIILMECHPCPSFSTDKANANNNKLEQLGIIDLNPVNILTTTSETHSHSPKLSRYKPNGTWYPLGRLLSMYLLRSSIFCNVYESILVDCPSCPSFPTAKSNTN